MGKLPECPCARLATPQVQGGGHHAVAGLQQGTADVQAALPGLAVQRCPLLEPEHHNRTACFPLPSRYTGTLQVQLLLLALSLRKFRFVLGPKFPLDACSFLGRDPLSSGLFSRRLLLRSRDLPRRIHGRDYFRNGGRD